MKHDCCGPLLGAHLSAAGSLVRPLERAAEIGAECLQIFVRPPSTWRARVLSDDEVEAFRSRRTADVFGKLGAKGVPEGAEEARTPEDSPPALPRGCP